MTAFLARLRAALASPATLGTARRLWERRTWVLFVLVLLLFGVTLRTCHDLAASRAQAQAAQDRAEEEAAARRAQVPVVQLVPQPVVDEAATDALRRAPELEAARKRLEGEVGRLRTLLAVRAETAPGPAVGRERPGEAPQAADVSLPRVLLRLGDPLRLTLDGVAYEGKAGSQALLATIGVLRAADGELLHRGLLSVPLTTVLAAPGRCEPEAPGRAWRAGPVGGATGQGWVAGLAGTYRLYLWGWEPEVLAAAAGGPGGVALLGGVLF